MLPGHGQMFPNARQGGAGHTQIPPRSPMVRMTWHYPPHGQSVPAAASLPVPWPTPGKNCASHPGSRPDRQVGPAQTVTCAGIRYSSPEALPADSRRRTVVSGHCRLLNTHIVCYP